MQFFDWKLDFPEILNGAIAQREGFDIVIGNPPYGVDFNDIDKDILKAKYDSIVERIRNSFLYFTGLSYLLMKHSGICCLIIPNEFLFQIYMTKARGFFLTSASLKSATNLGENVFDAIVPSCIILLKKEQRSNYEISLKDIRSIEGTTLEAALKSGNVVRIPMRQIYEAPNHIFSFDSEKSLLVNTIMKRGERFEHYCDDVANGISTSCDKVYIVSKDTVSKRKFESLYLKQCIRGGQLNKYYCPEDTGDFVLYITDDFDKGKAPRIHEYLKENKEILIRSSVEKKGGNRSWHVLFRPRYEDLFRAPKIMIRQTGDSIIACEDHDIAYYCINSVHVALIKKENLYLIDYLLGILNSRMSKFVYQQISQEAGRVLAEVKPQRIRMMPILTWSDSKAQQLIASTTSKIIKRKKGDPSANTERYEHEIDVMVYHLYNLTYAEAKVIDPALTEEEFANGS